MIPLGYLIQILFMSFYSSITFACYKFFQLQIMDDNREAFNLCPYMNFTGILIGIAPGFVVAFKEEGDWTVFSQTVVSFVYVSLYY